MQKMGKMSGFFSVLENDEDIKNVQKCRNETVRLIVGYAVSILILVLFQAGSGWRIYNLILFYIGVVLGQAFLGMNRYDKKNWATYILNLSIPFSLAIQFVLNHIGFNYMFLLVYIMIFYIFMYDVRGKELFLFYKPVQERGNHCEDRLEYYSFLGKGMVLVVIHTVNVLFFIRDLKLCFNAVYKNLN